MTAAIERVTAALESHGCRPKWSGANLHARCPSHDDKRDSLSGSEGDDGRALLKCMAGCETQAVVSALGLTMADLFASNGNGHAKRREMCAYTYVDESAKELFQSVRFEPKDFKQRRADGNGGWIWNLKDVRRVLYHLPDVISTVADGGTIYIAEGEKDADAINALPDAGNVIATCNPGGAGKWRPEFNEILRGATVVIVQDKDDPGRKHARQVADSLKGISRSIRIVESKEGKDAFDHLAAGYNLDQLVPVTINTKAPGVSAESIPLSDVVAVFKKWLHLPDPASLYAILGTIVANRMPGDPIWLLIVAGSSWGKSEQLGAATKLPDVFPAATITEAALLSGTANRDKAKEAKGGLLRNIGDYGIILCKDFGSILNMNRDARAAVLAALREVFDGSWTRHVGTDGGKTLHWSGKVGFLGGCTPTIDRHHAVMSAMGERFIFFRIQENVGDDEKLAGRALSHAGKEAPMRREMSDAVSLFLAGVRTDTPTPELDDEDRKRLIDLASFVVRCRSAVERDGYSREIELITGAEAPGRLAVILSKLLDAFNRIGLDRDEAWRVVKKMSFDSIPGLRRTIIGILERADTEMTTKAVALMAQYPTKTTSRALEELAAYGVVYREWEGQGHPDRWSLTAWAQTKLKATETEMLVGVREAQEKAKENAVRDVLISPTRVQTDFSVLPIDTAEAWRDES